MSPVLRLSGSMSHVYVSISSCRESGRALWNASASSIAKRVERLLGHLRQLQRRRLLQLEDRDARVDKLLQRHGDVLVLDGLMARVEDDADVPPQRDVR